MENINIASFDFDDTKINKKLEDLDKNLEEFNKKRLKELESLKELTKDLSGVVTLINKLTKEVDTNSESYKELAKEQDKLVKQIAKQQEKIAELTQKISQQKKEEDELNRVKKEAEKQTNAQRKAAEQLARANEILNQGYNTENKSIDQLREDRKALIKLRNQEVAVMGEQSEKAKQLNELIAEMTNQEKKLVSATEQRFYQIGDYANVLQDSFSGVVDSIKKLTTGDIVGGIDGLKSSFGGLVTSARAFVLTPIGAVITALVALGAAAKYVWDYNSAIKENLKLVEQMAEQTGKSADKIRQSIQSITDTYGRDFKEVLQEVKDLAQDFGLSYEQALDTYNKGLATGGNLNKEFGDSIREYGVLFDQAGYSADEFVSLLNTGFDLGIYTDKLPDAIKEAGISLNEQTKATRDALVNSFGAPFSDDILKRVKLGQTSVKDALNEIAKASKDANLNQQQLAQLTADVFRGAGEDAGGALVIFQALNQSVEDLNRPLTELQQRSEDLRVSYEELEKAKDEAFKSDAVIKLQNDLKILWNVTLKNLIKGFAEFSRIAVDGTTQINAGLLTFEAYVNNVIRAVEKLSFNNLKQSWEELKRSLTSFDWDSTYEKLAGDSSAEGQKRRAGREQVRDAVNSVAETSNTATRNRLNELNNQNRNAGPASEPTTKKVKTAKQKNDDAKKDLETAKKMQAEYYKELAELAYQYGQNELSEQIKLNAQKLEQAKILTDEMLALEIEKLNKIKALEDERANKEKERADQRVTQEYEASLKEIESLKVSENEKNALKIQAEQVLNAQKLANQQQLDANLLEQMRYNEEMKLELEAELYENRMAIEQQRRDFEFQQKMLRLQNENTSEKDMNLIMLSQQYTEEMALLRDKLNNQLITTEQFAEASANLTKWKVKTEEQIEQEGRIKNLNAVGDALNGIADLIGKNTEAGKIAGSAAAMINTWAGVTEVWKTPSTLAEPFATISRIGSTATVLASGLQAVKNINKVNTKALASGTGGGATPSLGTSTKNYTASYAGGAINGLDGNSTISGYNQSNIFGGLDGTSAIADAVRLGAEQGTAKGSQDGIVGLSTNRQIMNDAKY